MECMVMSVIILVAVVTNMIISVIADRKRAPAYDSGTDGGAADK